MPRKPSVPQYRLHKSSGRAVVTLPDGLGGRYDVQLGAYSSPESYQRYAQAIAEWETAGHRRVVATAKSAGRSINEVCLAFLEHAAAYYRRPDGSPTNELAEFKLTIRQVRELYGLAPAAAFTPQALKAVRQKMINADLSRGVINQRVGRIKRMFKWAVSEGLVPAAVYQGLQCVAGLAKGRGMARETDPVKSVPEAFVEVICEHVAAPVWAMIGLQRLTGMRPGEVCVMRACHLDTRGDVWLYRPARHKTQWRGKERVVALGKKAQEIVQQFFTTHTEDFLFSPARDREERFVIMRAARKAPVQPSQVCRRKERPEKRPGEYYTPRSYCRAIARACKAADLGARQQAENVKAQAEGREPLEVPAKVDDMDRLVPHWHPNQLRHNYATDVRRRYGLEAAQVTLGHSQANVTQVYAERDLGLAVRIAAEIG
jgi:integrase